MWRKVSKSYATCCRLISISSCQFQCWFSPHYHSKCSEIYIRLSSSPLWLVVLLCMHAYMMWCFVPNDGETYACIYPRIMFITLSHSPLCNFWIFCAKIDIASAIVGITEIVLHTANRLSSQLVRYSISCSTKYFCELLLGENKERVAYLKVLQLFALQFIHWTNSTMRRWCLNKSSLFCSSF